MKIAADFAAVRKLLSDFTGCWMDFKKTRLLCELLKM